MMLIRRSTTILIMISIDPKRLFQSTAENFPRQFELASKDLGEGC